MKEKSVHACELKWKSIKGRISKSDGINIGFLYNLLKKHGINRPPAKLSKLKQARTDIEILKNEIQRRKGDLK
jgi:hypothetical protein